MSDVLAAVRALHYASTLLLFGELVLALIIAAPAWHAAGSARSAADGLWHRMCIVTGWSLGVSIASWLAWLACTASEMSGMPVAEALTPGTLALVLGRTGFGHDWLLRLALAALLVALLVRMRRMKDPRMPGASSYAALAVAGTYVASLAWAGHAAAGEGTELAVDLAADGVHLLAAGAWLGALPGLVAALRQAPELTIAAHTTRRFSTVGLVCVSALLVTGFVNSWHLVGDLPGLFGTAYGRLLLAKLALFAAMLALAARNRLVLTPCVSRDAGALLRLRRNALLETVAGVGVIAIVGVLGITVPAAHQSPVWPFSRGLDLQPADPMSYATSPVPYTTNAIARGAALYAQNCSACHGPAGHGDGPAAASLARRPANLAEHASSHRPGDLYWWIAHGIADTPMPSFGESLDDADIWTLVQYLHALSDAEAARTMSPARPPSQPVVAPDFTFETKAGAQESLARQASTATLLVLYSLPQSQPRLRGLEAQKQRYAAKGVRVIAVPMQPTSEAIATADPMHAVTGPDVPMAYAMFAHGPGDEATTPPHVEFLLDREGYLRRRWVGVPEDPERQTDEILREVSAIGREPLPPRLRQHAH